MFARCLAKWSSPSSRLWVPRIWPRMLLGAALLALTACTGSTAPSASPTSVPAASPTTASQPAAAANVAPSPTAAPLGLLKVDPVQGYVGNSFTIKGEGLPPEKEVVFQWATVDGGWDMKPYPETVEFYARKFTPKRLDLGRAVSDAKGQVTVNLTVPDDYGEVHDIFATVAGQDQARGGYRVLPQFTVTPLEGPVGTAITISAKGIGSKDWESTWGVNWDNKYSGFLSAVTTRGSITAVIRAAGPTGKHTLDVWHAGQTVPYLNWEQSPQSHIPVFNYVFNVTGEPGTVPPLALEWPQKGAASMNGAVVRTTASSPTLTTGASAVVEPAAGPILTNATLKATKLPVGTPVDLFYMTARGSRTSGLGWGLAELPLGTATTDKEGNLSTAIQVPDDLGGWHVVKIVGQGKVLAEAPFLAQPSLTTVTPSRVKVGDNVKVQLKGVGWTELDNIYAVVYDNSYIGFACGFNSSGDVTLNLKASGGPGVHLIDLYPAVYQGHGKPPWLYDTPQLTALRDHPGLTLGYGLPIFRLAIEVTE